VSVVYDLSLLSGSRVFAIWGFLGPVSWSSRAISLIVEEIVFSIFWQRAKPAQTEVSEIGVDVYVFGLNRAKEKDCTHFRGLKVKISCF
jgi:hypothetical protein